MTLSYPLQWPDHVPRTPQGKKGYSRFDISQDVAHRHMVKEIGLLGGSNIVLSTNIPLRRDGLPYANHRASVGDSGVAVYFTFKKQARSFACDRYFEVWENMRALGKTIEAMRGISRWGAHEVLDQMFQGFTALPPPGAMTTPPPMQKQWFEVLGVAQNCPLAVAEAAWKALCRANGGGSVELNNAIEQARKAQ